MMTGNSFNFITENEMISRITISKNLRSSSAANILHIVIQISFLLKNRYLL